MASRYCHRCGVTDVYAVAAAVFVDRFFIDSFFFAIRPGRPGRTADFGGRVDVSAANR
jgi:hypothetical protein